MRTIVIGDIHGCCKALLSLLDAISPGADDLLIFLGDYVDRGPDSKGVIETLIDVARLTKTIFLQGNHEIMFRGALGGLDPAPWLELGGRPTLTSYGGTLDRVPSQHLNFLDACRAFFETESHIFVHANYIPELPMDEQSEFSLYWEHLVERFPGPHVSGKSVFCGHTPQISGQVADYGHLVCVDTFCFGTGWLTAMDVASRHTWQANREGHLRRQSGIWRILRRSTCG